MDVQQTLRRYLEARLDRSVSADALVIYAYELAEAVMKSGGQ